MKPFILTLLTCAFSIGAISAQAKDDKIVVRPLDKNKIESWHLGINSGVTIMENAADVEKLIKDPKLLGKHPDAAKQLAGQVDFSKEKIVLVRWSDGGPPFGSLKHDVKKNGEAIEFYVQLPPDVEERGEALGFFANFFAVPKDIPVSLGVARKSPNELFAGTTKIVLTNELAKDPAKKAVEIADAAEIAKIVATIKLQTKSPSNCLHMLSADFTTPSGVISVSLCDHCFDFNGKTYAMPAEFYKLYQAGIQ